MKITLVETEQSNIAQVEMRFRHIPAGGGCIAFWYGETPVTEEQWADVMGEGPRSRKPKLGVSFLDAQEFCKRLGEDYRLPTDLEQCWAMGRDPEDLWRYAVYGKDTCPEVGTKHPNEYGLLDVRGLCWEWAETGQEDKSLRGGSWYLNSFICRSAYRNSSSPDFRLNAVGFRVVCCPPDA